MQVTQNYNTSLTVFSSIYMNIRSVPFYEEHSEFFDDILNLISATICRVGDLIEYDLILLDSIIKTKNIQKELLFKVIKTMIIKLDTFVIICNEYTTLQNNILLYIENI